MTQRHPIDKPLRVLDLFSGLGGATRAFVDRGHVVDTLDYDAKFNPFFRMDIREFHPTPGLYDFVWASPDCRRFSVAALGKHWTKRGEVHYPETEGAKEAVQLVEAALRVIKEAKPRFGWILENPTGKLRSLGTMRGHTRRTVTYCQYGASWRKSTDLWGGFPSGLQFLRRCSNGDPCHEAAPAGSKTGLQGTRAPEARAEVPYGLSLAVCEAVERAAGVYTQPLSTRGVYT